MISVGFRKKELISLLQLQVDFSISLVKDKFWVWES